MLDLRPHNQQAHDAAMSAFKDHQRVAVVHATGTGKSYIIASIVEHFEHPIVIAPSDVVLHETEEICKKGTEFSTYAYQMIQEESKTGYDIIVLDEFHRTGAGEWGAGIARLIAANPDAKIFGTTATPIRYLDNNRNMANEMFDGNVVSTLTISDAIDRGILPMPVYVASLYDIDSTYTEALMRIRGSKYGQDKREEYEERLKRQCKDWEQANGVSNIIRKYFNKDVRKIIVFCSHISLMKNTRQMLTEWFNKAGFNNLQFYRIDSKTTGIEKKLDKFRKNDFDGIKIAISVNMLNEGIHVPDIDAIIMLRSSVSPIIIEQQVGRCLTADNKGKTPVVLDLVNNLSLIHVGKNGEYFTTGGSEKRQRKMYHHHRSEGFPFTVIDECKDIRAFIGKVHEVFYNRTDWTYEDIAAEAKKYETRNEFAKANEAAYAAASSRGILDEVCAHMKVILKQWTYEDIAAEAKKYETRNEFMKANKNAYQAAYKRGILDEVCAHMKVTNKQWTYEDIAAEAKKYKTRSEFAKASTNAYSTALRKGILDEVCAHMDVICKQWTYEDIAAEAKKYKTKGEFAKANKSAYAAASSRGILDEVCAHMDVICKQWTYEDIAAEAKKYKTRPEFMKASVNAYNAAIRRGILDEICTHMKVINKQWTYEDIAAEAKKYETRNEFRKASTKAYNAAQRRGILDEVCAHMKPKK